MSYFALLDDAQHNHALLFTQYQSSQFISPNEIKQLDHLLRKGWQCGWHAVIFADYEFGLPLLNVPSAHTGYLNIHWFANKQTLNNPVAWLNEHSAQHTACLSVAQRNVSETQYLNDIHSIHQAISRGDTYQINYTTRLHLQAYGTPIALYRRLRQPVPYAALSCLPNADGTDHWTLCFSPELFLKINPNGSIETEPMKGTAPILHDGNDTQRAIELQNDPKNRAENVMIVDLLRNDLGKIAQTGGISVPEPFKVSPFGSVWQMTSRIIAQPKPQTTLADIFQACFPCGSITGAPKRMSMHIINQLENEKRGIYTGSIGHIMPSDNSLGFSGTLNVVIRTLELQPTQKPDVYQGVYGVGSGIVIDSDPQSEYEECHWKSHFLQALTPEFGIFETLRIEHKQCALLHRHLDRLQQSAQALNLPLPNDFRTRIEQYIQQMSPDCQRLKIQLDTQGIHFTVANLTPLASLPKVHIHPTPFVPSVFQSFKTTHRQALDKVWQQAEQNQAFDGLLFNADGILLEGGRSNVFVKIHQQWHTPSLDLNILNGVMRQEILAHPQHYLDTECIYESHITQEMLENAEEICLSNALRGLFTVHLSQA